MTCLKNANKNKGRRGTRRASPPSTMTTISNPTRRGRLSAPQLQAQLSRVSDRTRLRRSKKTCWPKEHGNSWQGVGDLCHAHVSREWLYHFDACAGSVPPPHDYITNVHRRLGNRSYAGFGECRLCGSFADSQLEHGDTYGIAEATRGQYAVRLADPGITTEPRGLTETQSGLADIFTTTAAPERSATLDVCVASSNGAAAQGDAAQAASKSQTSHCRRKIPDLRALKASCIVSWFGQQMVGHTQRSLEPHRTQLASHPSNCQQKPSSTDGNIESNVQSYPTYQ